LDVVSFNIGVLLLITGAGLIVGGYFRGLCSSSLFNISCPVGAV
jgi:hypothetical protein